MAVDAVGSVARMIEVQAVHTSALAPTEVRGVREMLDTTFDGNFSDDDFDHALGGMHVLARDGAELVGHAAVVMRRLLHEGRALRTGYVEAVAVRPDRQRLGIGALVMDEVERIVRGGYELGALGAAKGAANWYAARGWEPWSGRTAVLAPDGLRPTPDEDGAVHVLPVTARLTPGAELVCDWRGGAVW
jgi:aminoglycoside 2'-N-acetyltransferase I